VLGGHAPRLILVAGPGLAAAGAYEIAARLGGLAGTAASLPLKVLMPLAGHLEVRDDVRRLRDLLARSTRYVTLLALPAVIALLLFPDLLVLAWTGRPAPAGTVLTARLIVLAVAAMIVVSPLRLLLRASGRAGLEAAATAAGALVQLAAAAALARRFGAPGVGLATLAGSLVALGLVASGGRRSRSLTLTTVDAARAAAPPLVAGLGALLAGLLWALLLPQPAAAGRAEAFAALFLRLLPSGLVFAGLAWWGRAACSDDLLLLRDAVHRPAASTRGTS